MPGCIGSRVLQLTESRRHSYHTQRQIFRARVSVPHTKASSDEAVSVDSLGTESELVFFNSLTRQKEPFKTVEPGVVRFYSCGPTVYDYAHIGNFRAFLTYDVIKRWLIFKGYTVRHVMNLTDVDDKIIARVQREKCSAKELTDRYSNAFFDDLKLLNVIPADHYPRATQHIEHIETFVNGLKKRGYAYERQGSTYFSVSSFSDYGRLAQLDRRQCENASASDSDEYDKDDIRDFALWKTYKPEDGDVYWNNSLGKGRPGWHIECSCMAMEYLGSELDIHAGGIDLVFPHHENEIAQSEALTGKQFASFWLHNGFVNIDNEKMSKSLGNFRTLRDIVKNQDDARAFRYMVVTSQYRSALAFTDKCLKSARSTIKRLNALQKRLREAEGEGGKREMEEIVRSASENFVKGMDDDLNTPRAAAAMFSLVNSAEKMLKAGRIGKDAAMTALECLNDMDKLFGVFYTPELGLAGVSSEEAQDTEAPLQVVQLLEQRVEARKAKDFERADQIRDMIAASGFSVVDTPQGAKLQRVES
ncbi:Cysteine--tRNA ligase [Gracilariopsis chorda]|uniref:Cysteine--tRNA ligase n=1 Tax=Gracilariopsis chorda TaxID=448386 RepID=A0A2V3J570_9FLOR|nr:Cysteine--tRNA ligase [Gracilariopsis chorda]|eukprot:PXF49514.1 Cysteine--tRNA ligase [Gracilariopsis chorda]